MEELRDKIGGFLREKKPGTVLIAFERIHDDEAIILVDSRSWSTHGDIIIWRMFLDNGACSSGHYFPYGRAKQRPTTKRIDALEEGLADFKKRSS